MKNLIFLSLAIFASSSMAARLPTDEEFTNYLKMIYKSPSVRPLINDIRSGKINPIAEASGGRIISNAGRSSLAAGVIRGRMDISAPIGSESENLELLELISSHGVELDIPQPTNWNSGPEELSLLMYASQNCADGAISLMESRGANLGGDGYWVYAFKASLNFDLDSKEDITCNTLSLKLLRENKEMSLKSIYLLLSDSWGMNQNLFMEGASMDLDMRPELKELMSEKFGFTFSTRPGKNVDQKFIDFIVDKMGPPTSGNDEHGPEYWENWWPKLNGEQKAWACYLSTFDEAFKLLKLAGLSEEEISTTPLPYSRSPRFGTFAVKILIPYCDSIRN